MFELNYDNIPDEFLDLAIISLEIDLIILNIEVNKLMSNINKLGLAD